MKRNRGAPIEQALSRTGILDLSPAKCRNGNSAPARDGRRKSRDRGRRHLVAHQTFFIGDSAANLTASAGESDPDRSFGDP
jgi:hypothetical protein